MGLEMVVKTFIIPFIAIWGTIASIGLIVCGIISCISVHWECIVIGVYTILVGICIIFMEAPMIYKISDVGVMVHKCTARLVNWMRVALYFVLVIPEFFCLGLSNIIAIVFLCTLAMSQGTLWAFGGASATSEDPKGDAGILKSIGLTGKNTTTV
eukprot:CFRG0771T1